MNLFMVALVWGNIRVGFTVKLQNLQRLPVTTVAILFSLFILSVKADEWLMCLLYKPGSPFTNMV